MGIITDLFLTESKLPMQKKFIATAIGHMPWGTGVEEYFCNLYEYEDGTREYEIFDGGQYFDTPEKVDFSTKAQVEAWLYGGPVPVNLLSYDALIDEYNKTRPTIGQGTVVSDTKREVKKNYAHPVDKSFSQASNTNLDPLDIMDEDIKNALNNQIIKHKVRKK